MRVLICGGRDYLDYERFTSEVNKLVGHTVPIIIQGGAKGADYLAKLYAHRYKLEMWEYPADWKKHGRAAGVIRNQEMLDKGKPDLVIAFPGGRGTADMVNRAKKEKVKVVEINP